MFKTITVCNDIIDEVFQVICIFSTFLSNRVYDADQ